MGREDLELAFCFGDGAGEWNRDIENDEDGVDWKGGGEEGHLP